MLEHQKTNEILGQKISEREFKQLKKSWIVITPLNGKFWESQTGEAGIYILISGKIRLLDENEQLLTTIKEKSAFGEATLFREINFKKYAARKAANDQVTIIFISQESLLPLMKKYAEIKKYLQQKAAQLNGEESPEKNNVNSEIPKEKTEPKSVKPYFPNPTQTVRHLWQKTIKRYPIILQQSTSDCGCASLAMICLYWGKNISINDLRNMMNVDRNGASLKSVMMAAENLGFATCGATLSYEGLMKQNLPAIIYWEGNHYIVIYAINKKQVIVGDPAIGQLTIKRAEFEEKWTKVTLLIEPTINWNKTHQSKADYGPFWELLKPHSVVIFEIFLASLFIQICGLCTPMITQLILDGLMKNGSSSEITLNSLGFGLIIISIFRVVMTTLREYLLDHTAMKIDLSLILGFIRHTLGLPLSFFESSHVGDIISRIEENRKIQRFLSGEALTIFLDFLTIFIYLSVMFKYSWELALISLLIVPLFFLLAVISTPFLQIISRQIFNATAAENSYLIEALNGIYTIKASATEKTVQRKWEKLFNQELKKNFSGQMINNFIHTTSNLIQTLATIGLLWYGANLVIKTQLTPGQLIAFNMMFGQIIQPFDRLNTLWNQLQEMNIAFERINDIFTKPLEENFQQQNKQFIPNIQGEIKFENVTFRYRPDGEMNILENLSFTIKPGQMIALVGRSGSGKTTIGKLILGLYPINEGRILIDSYDLNNIALSSLRQQFGIVDQDTFLFSGTIKENISLGNPQANLTQIEEIAKLAGCHNFIEKLPLGYGSQIGEGGVMLSGGQRQRLAIARALLGNPKLLILDEATSHLDTESERIIQNNLDKIRQDKTILVIAHRLSTIRKADLILVLDQGRLVEQGNHEELMAKKGHYFYLNQQQSENL